MKKEELKKAYDELEFTENLQDQYFYNITSRECELKKHKKIRLAPVLLCILLASTTIYAAEKLDLLKWYYGEEAKTLPNGTDEKTFTAQNEHLKMSVEDALFTEEYGIVFVHIQALDKEGNAFMSQNKNSLSVKLSIENDEVPHVGGSSVTSWFCEEISNEENWYYRVQTVNYKSGEGESPDMARVSFPDSYPVEDENMEDSAQALTVEFPVSQTISAAKTYTKCGDFRKVSVSPLAITISWDAGETQGEYLSRVKKLEIEKTDGTILKLEHIFGKGYDVTADWDFIFMTESDREGLAWLTAVPKEILVPEEIKSVTLNGILCE